MFIDRILSIKNRRKGQSELKATGEAPTLVGYLTMAMKLTPNLERAASFAGEQLDGQMGQELKQKISEGHLRLHSGADEGLSKFAKRWEQACPELDRSIYLIRSSVNERTKDSRMRTLNRAFGLVLQGARERMRGFASSIYLPTLVIYSMGVLLPLVFVVILPVLSVINIHVGLVHVLIIYCFLLPLLVYMLSNQVLSRRPATLQPPKVPFQPNQPRALLIAVAVSIPLPALGLAIKVPPDIGVLTVLWGGVLGIVTYLFLTSARAFKRREEIVQMEGEFCDALVQLGNRVSEGRPAEDALEHVAGTMHGSKLGQVFEEASANVRLGGMGLRAALFDDRRGALRFVHSGMIRGTLKMLVDLIERSTSAAGDAILQTAEHLRELRGVEVEIRRSMGEVVTSMRSVALFFAPLVTSVAARMQGLLSSKTASTGFLGSTEVSPPAFLLVLGIYIVLLTAILINYAVEIELGEDRLAKRVAIASALPVALGVFTAGTILGGQMLSSIVG
ncbi:MAG: type II secretion system F family protein [Hadesarchaea archaeon]|nr:type II secretion system F family protein [Hadesarchaea archaeon]